MKNSTLKNDFTIMTQLNSRIKEPYYFLNNFNLLHIWMCEFLWRNAKSQCLAILFWHSNNSSQLTTQGKCLNHNE